HAAMRHSREQGAFGAEIYVQSMRQRDLEQLRLEADLRRSLAEQAFVVHYQPKVTMGDGVIRGFEALLRWRRSGAGLVGPEQFIPQAESSGLIIPIGRQVLLQACLDTADLRRQFPQVTVSVNVSGRQFSHPELEQQVAEALQIS